MLSNLVSQNNTDYITLHIATALERSCLIAVLNYGTTRLIESHKGVHFSADSVWFLNPQYLKSHIDCCKTR